MRAKMRVLFSCLLAAFFCVACWGRPSEPEEFVFPGVRRASPRGMAGLHRPLWSADGGKLAFVYQVGGEGRSVGKIYTLDLATGGTKMIEGTEKGGRLIESWSARNEIAFRADGDRKTGLWGVNADGSEEPRFLGEGYSATWSPDGGQVAFDTSSYVEATQVYTGEVWILNPATGVKQLVFTRSGHLLSIGDLAWSPDGTRLALTIGTYPSAGAAGPGESDVYVLELATDALQQVTQGGYNGSPTWSPDGRLIAYTNVDETWQGRLVIAWADGRCSVRPLPPAGKGTRYSDPAWSPDGRQIAFSYGGLIYVLDVEAVLGVDFLASGPECP